MHRTPGFPVHELGGSGITLANSRELFSRLCLRADYGPAKTKANSYIINNLLTSNVRSLTEHLKRQPCRVVNTATSWFTIFP